MKVFTIFVIVANAAVGIVMAYLGDYIAAAYVISCLVSIAVIDRIGDENKRLRDSLREHLDKSIELMCDTVIVLMRKDEKILELQKQIK